MYPVFWTLPRLRSYYIRKNMLSHLSKTGSAYLVLRYEINLNHHQEHFRQDVALLQPSFGNQGKYH